jgi:hypothetical protein
MKSVIDKFFEALGVQNWDFKGKRIVNAGRSQGKRDYVTNEELGSFGKLDISKLNNFNLATIGTQNGKFVIAYKLAGTVMYISIPLDGTSTVWTHSNLEP